MCNGNIKCTACSNKIGKMARTPKFLNKNSLTTVGGAVLGYIAAKFITSKVTFLQKNVMIDGGVKLVGGLVLSGMSNKIAQSAGIGMAIDGATVVVKSILPAETSKALGIGHVGRIGTVDLNRVHRVTGIGEYRSDEKLRTEASLVQ